MNFEEQKKLVGTRIKNLRKEHNETQLQLAKAIDISQDAISKIEQGKIALTLDNQLKIADHFNVSHDYICTGINSNTILDALLKNISFHYKDSSIGEEKFKYPILKINNNFLQYLINSARIEYDRSIPKEIKPEWIKIIKNEFYTNTKNSDLQEKITFVPVKEIMIYPDSEKQDWSQTDLLRAIDKTIDSYLYTNKL